MTAAFRDMQQMDEVAATARALGLAVETLKIQRGEDIAGAFDTLKGRPHRGRDGNAENFGEFHGFAECPPRSPSS